MFCQDEFESRVHLYVIPSEVLEGHRPVDNVPERPVRQGAVVQGWGSAGPRGQPVFQGGQGAGWGGVIQPRTHHWAVAQVPTTPSIPLGLTGENSLMLLMTPFIVLLLPLLSHFFFSLLLQNTGPK